MKLKLKYNQLGSTNMYVSNLSFGASVFNNFFKDATFDNSPESLNRVKSIIRTAISVGINYFDVAPWYGNAQYLLAVGLEEIPRSSYYLATKIGRYNSDKGPKDWFDFSYERTIESVENSLKLFNTDHIDLIQVHDFEFAPSLDQIVNETLPALAFLQKQGKVKYIGINSYSIQKLKELLELSTVKIDTVLTFTHLTLDDTSLLDHVEYFREKGVGIINASPLSMGLYTEQGPPEWHRVPDRVKTAAKLARDYCKSRNVNLVKLAMHFSVENEAVDTTVVSMGCENFIRDNVEGLKELNDKELNVLNEIREKFFVPLNYSGFGDAEVISYRKKMAKYQ